jgi:acyl-CoA dehydrogenase
MMALSSVSEHVDPPRTRSPAADEPLLTAARRVANTFARPFAPLVDREARFPREAMIGIRDAGLLGALVPHSLGGLGSSLSDVARMTELLARGCSSTGMIFAMHQIQVACLVRHAAESPWFAKYLAEIGSGRELLASVTSEIGVGGDLRSSIAAVTPNGARCSLEKKAPTVSYGEHADALLVTARRSADAPKNDQVLVLARKGDYALEPAGEWNTLGMRGTCSPGFTLRAAFEREQIVLADFADIAQLTMVPVSHLLWSAVWLGIAADALGRAHGFVRAEAKQKPGTVPPGALRLAEASALLDTLRARCKSVLEEYEALCAEKDGARSLGHVAWAAKINGLKVSASELAVDIVTRALMIIGIAGYREDGELSVARHLRDVFSAKLMINNDRIYANNAALLLVQKELG